MRDNTQLFLNESRDKDIPEENEWECVSLICHSRESGNPGSGVSATLSGFPLSRE
jgi:hypothetical protein